MSNNISGQFTSSNPEGVVEAPKGARFFRDEDNFFLSYGGQVRRLNVNKKAFLYGSYSNPLFPFLKEDTISFSTPYESWIKASDGINKTGWRKIGTSRSFVTIPVIAPEPILEGVENAWASDGASYFLKTNGELWTAGQNNYGQLGLGFTSEGETASLSLTDVKVASVGLWDGNSALALKNDGTLWGTGTNYAGNFGNGTYNDSNAWIQLDLQGDITGSGEILAIQAFGYGDISALLMSDNTLWVSTNQDSYFGLNTSGSFVQVSSDVKQISGGSEHLLYLKNDDTLWGFGQNWGGQLGTGDDVTHNYDDPYQIDTDVKFINAGTYHSGYIKNDDTLWMVGSNWDGQLGNNTYDDQYSPVQIDTNVKYVSGGGDHTLYVKTNGDLYGMGGNYSGQLGIDNGYNDIAVPTLIDSNVDKISAGGEHSLYVKNDKTVYGMGYNYYYQIKVSSNGYYYTNATGWTDEGVVGINEKYWRTSIYGGNKFLAGGGYDQFNYGGNTQLIYSNDGIAWSTCSIENNGLAIRGIAYNGTDKYISVLDSNISTYINQKRSLSQTFNSQTASFVAVGNLHAMVIQDGVLYGVGKNNQGQLGRGYISDGELAYVSCSTNVRSVSAGTNFTTFVKNDDTLWGMGLNLQGELGDGTNTFNRPSPVQTATNVSASYSGYLTTLFIKNDGTLWGTGVNFDGQLGSSSLGGNIYTPIQLDSDVKHASVYNQTLYVKNDGTLWGMGDNSYGQLGTGDLINRSASYQIDTNVKYCIAAFFSSYYIKNDGTLWGMGRNHYGQLGLGDYTDRNVPTQITSSVIEVFPSEYYGVFFKNENNDLYGIGSNQDHILGLESNNTNFSTPTYVTNNVKMADYAYQCSYILKNDGTVYSIGNDTGEGCLGFGYRNESYESSDGITWTTGSLKRNTNLGLLGITYGGDQFIAHGDTRIETSPDGINWTQRTPPFNGPIVKITYGNGKYVGARGYAGNNQYFYTPSPIQLFDGNTASFASVGETATLLLENSKLYGAGYNQSYQLGPQTNGKNYIEYFTEITSSIKDAALGANHIIILKNDGTLWVSGHNNFGSLGIGNYNSPILGFVQNTSSVFDAPIVSVVAAQYFSAVLTDNGKIWSWGYNDSSGVTYPGPVFKTNTPSQPWSQPFTASFIAGGGDVAGTIIAIDTNKNLWGVGLNTQYQITSSNVGSIWEFQLIDTNVVSASIKNNHTLYIKDDNTFWGRGNNSFGQLGSAPIGNVYNPVQLDTDVVYCSAGSGHTAYIKSDGSLWTMGRNNYGQLGIGNFNDITSSVQVDTNVAKVYCGIRNTFYIKTDKTVWGMGGDFVGSLGEGIKYDAAMYSTNGINWSASFTTNYINNDIAYGNNRFVITNNNIVDTSTDGITWTSSYMFTGSSSEQSSIIFDGTNFVACIKKSPNDIYKSTDGINWTGSSTGNDSQWGTIAYGDGKYVLLAYQPNSYVSAPAEIRI